MAATSGQVNIVKITDISYADADLVAGVIPVELTSLTGLIKNGTVNPDFPEPSVTSEYDEINQATYRATKGTVQNKVSIQLVTSRASELIHFWGKALVAGTAGTTPDKIKLGRSSATNKYVKITGKNIEGQTVTLELLNAMPVSSWSGAMGEQSETVGITVNFYLLQSADGSGDEAYLNPAF